MFELNKMQKEIKNSVKVFAKGEFEKECCIEMDRDSLFPDRQRKKAAETGFLGVHFPEEYLGGDLGVVENALIAEELCKKDSTAGCALMLSTLGSECLLRFGSEGMKKKYLPEIANGNLISSEAFSEQASDNTYSNIKTTAVKKSNGWLINGNKINVINGKNADILFILCKTEHENLSNSSALSVFIADSSLGGISIIEKNESLGLRMLKRSDVFIKNLLLPDENHIQIVSSDDDSKKLSLYRAEVMVQIAAMATGIAKGAYERTLKYIKLREQFGKKLSDFQITRHKIAEMATMIELASLITYKAARSIDTNRTDPSLCAMAKNCATRNALKVTDEAIQLFGGYGYTSDYEVERYYRDAKVLELLGGGKSYLKDIIAEKEIGRSKAILNR